MGNNLLQSRSAETDPQSSSGGLAGDHSHAAAPTAATATPVWGGRIVKLAVLLLVFGAGWFAANARHEHAQKESLPPGSSSEAHNPSTVIVTVEPVTRRSVQRTVEALGTLHGFEEVSISARIEGRIRKVLHDVADRVRPDELLLEIDPTDYQLSVQQADRALQVELAKLGLKSVPDATLDLGKVPSVVKAKSVMEHAKSRHDRLSRLAITKNVSAEDSESAASDYRTSQAEYDNQMIQAESDLATIQMKQVELQVAREQLANTKILVPTPTAAIPGAEDVVYVVSQRSVSEGTLVRPGTEIFRLVISQTLKLRVPVPERYSAEVQLNQPVQVFAATSAKPFAGTVTRIYPIVEPTTRTFQVEIQVPNPTGELKPGSFAKASILTRVDSQAVTVPLAALIQFAGITKIFLAEEGQAKEVPVTLGTQTTEWVEITKPTLPDQAQVITSGQTAIANETSIIIREPAPPATGATSASSADSSDSPDATKHPTRGVRE